MGAGFSFVCVFLCCINKVQCVVSPCCKVHMLVELWQNCLQVCVVEVTGYDEKAIRFFVCCSLMELYSSRSASLAFAHGGM